MYTPFYTYINISVFHKYSLAVDFYFLCNATEIKPDVVFIDSLTSFHSADENNNNEMREIISYLHKLAARTNIALAIIHHLRKPKKHEENLEMSQNDIVGAGVLLRLIGNAIGVRKEETHSGKQLHVIRSLATWFQPFDEFAFTLENEETDLGDRVVMNIDLEPHMGDNLRSLVWDTIKKHFGDGRQFTKKELESVLPDKVSESYLKIMFAKWVKQNKLKRIGCTRNARYSLPPVRGSECTNSRKTRKKAGFNWDNRPLPENIPNGEAFLEPLLLEYPGNPEIANLSFQQEGNQNQSAEDIQDFSHVKSPIIIDDKGTGKTNSDNTGCTNKSCLIQGVVAHWYTNSRSGNKNADSPTNIIKFPGLYKGATLEPSCPGDINFEEPPCMDEFYESLNIQLSSLNKAEDDAV